MCLMVNLKNRKTTNFAGTFLTGQTKAVKNRVTGAIWQQMKNAKIENLQSLIKKLTSKVFLSTWKIYIKTPNFASTIWRDQ